MYTILHVGVIQTNGATAKVPSVANRVADCSLACGPPRMTPSTHPRQYEPFPTSLWASGSRYLIPARCWIWVPLGERAAYGRVTPHTCATAEGTFPRPQCRALDRRGRSTGPLGWCTGRSLGGTGDFGRFRLRVRFADIVPRREVDMGAQWLLWWYSWLYSCHKT